MTGPTEKQIEAACRAYAYRLEQQRNEIHKASGRPNLARSEENMAAAVDRSWRLHRSGMEAALTAALAVEAGAVGVKPLEWRRSNRAGSFVAHGAGLMYAADQDHDMVILGKWEGSSVLKSAHDTMEAAQSFAQADYEARIRSALTTSPASSAVEGEAVATEPHNIYPMSADPNIYTASSYANRSSGGFAPTPAGDDHFHDLREAYIRGATWYRKNEDFGELLYKAAYDYADKATAPLPASPAPQTEGK